MREHQLIDIEKILVNPENPRHTQIMIADELFIMQQLVRNPKEAKAMYKLINDIYTNGWYPQSIITVTYDKKKEKFVAWDGNRRLTAMKILKRPQLVESFKYFSYTQIRNIYAMSAGIQGEEYFQIPCYVADSFKECSGYIRNIHTTDTGALKWDTASIKRFEDKMGAKNIFSQLQGFCKKAFEGIDNNFSVNKFEKIVSSKIGKEYLNISFDNNVLIPFSPINELDKKVLRIVQDIANGKITSNTIKNSANIEKYLYGNIEKVSNKSFANRDKINENTKNRNEQMEIASNNIEEKHSNANESELTKNKINESISYNKIRLTRKDNSILFKNINCRKLKYSNERAKGIKNLCYEIQHLSFGNLYKNYPIAYCFLIRSLLEQSSIYFLINKGKWEKWKKANNNLDLRLEKIINKISIDKQNLIEDDTILRAWETCFDNEGVKNYLDLVIHHPYKVIANVEAIKTITDIGIFAIIQFFINS